MRILIGGTAKGTLRHITRREYREECGMLTSWADGSLPLYANRAGAPWAMDNDVPAGIYARVCPWCGRAFHHDDESARYCSERCKKSAQQARTYQRRRARK